jgi:hypothetical protein
VDVLSEPGPATGLIPFSVTTNEPRSGPPETRFGSSPRPCDRRSARVLGKPKLQELHECADLRRKVARARMTSRRSRQRLTTASAASWWWGARAAARRCAWRPSACRARTTTCSAWSSRVIRRSALAAPISPHSSVQQADALRRVPSGRARVQLIARIAELDVFPARQSPGKSPLVRGMCRRARGTPGASGSAGRSSGIDPSHLGECLLRRASRGVHPWSTMMMHVGPLVPAGPGPGPHFRGKVFLRIGLPPTFHRGGRRRCGVTASPNFK